jgi:hypothetical protein
LPKKAESGHPLIAEQLDAEPATFNPSFNHGPGLVCQRSDSDANGVEPKFVDVIDERIKTLVPALICLQGVSHVT